MPKNFTIMSMNITEKSEICKFIFTFTLNFGCSPENADQKIVGNSLQPIGVIITRNLFIKVPH